MKHGSDAVIVVSELTKIFQPLQLRLRSLRPVRREPPVYALRELDLDRPPGGNSGPPRHERSRQDDAAQDPGNAHPAGLATGDKRSFYWRLTGRQNLEFFAAFQGLGPQAARSRIEELREQIGLDGLDRRFGVYSSGMRHRLAIARALLRQPRILLLDEPTRSLDPLASDVLRRLIRDTLVAQMRCTVVLATHNLPEAEELCDRLAVLHEGRLVGCGTVGELRQQSDHHPTTLAGIFAHLTTRSALP